MAIGQGQIVRFGGEASSAGGTLMFGILDVQVHRPFAAGIAQVVQDPNSRSVSPGLATTEWTPFPLVIPAPPFNPGWRQFLYPRNTFARIGNVITWAYHGRTSRRSASGGNIGESPPRTRTNLHQRCYSLKK